MNTRVIRRIHLHGHLRRYGAVFEIACLNAADAAKALITQVPGFKAALETGVYKVVRRAPGEPRRDYDESELLLGLGGVCDLHFVPAPQGAKSGGIGKVIIGAIITAVAIVGAVWTGGASLTLLSTAAGTWGISWTGMAAMGVMLMFSGVSMMLTPSASAVKPGERAEERRSYILNGSLESSVQGNPVPVVYGRYKVGLTMISAGIAPEAA